MQVELVSPEAVLFSGEATQVLTRTTEGDIAFLEQHAMFIGALDIGEVQLWTDEGVVKVACNGGFVEVSNNAVSVLTDEAALPDDVDVAAVQAELAEAQAALAAADAEESIAAQAVVAWAELRLRVAEAG